MHDQGVSVQLKVKAGDQQIEQGMCLICHNVYYISGCYYNLYFHNVKKCLFIIYQHSQKLLHKLFEFVWDIWEPAGKRRPDVVKYAQNNDLRTSGIDSFFVDEDE